MKTTITTASFKTIATALFFSLLSTSLIAQVGIGTTTPDGTAQLDITSGSKGLLIPRMNATARGNITGPAVGLIVYQTDAPAGFYYYDGSAWNLIGTSSSLTGFSGTISNVSVTNSTTLTGWTTTTPFYNSGSFNPTTGLFTVPATGTYAITATINYKTSAAISVTLGAGVDPYFEIKRTSPTTTSLLQGYLPILNVNVALILTLRALLGNADVSLAGTVNLNAGDVISLSYNPNGLLIAITLGGTLGSGVVWSVTRIK